MRRILRALGRAKSRADRAGSNAWKIAAAALLAPLPVFAQQVTDPALQVSVAASGLILPTAMAFLGPDDFLVVQKPDGKVLRVLSGAVQPTPVLDVAVNSSSERGLLGIAINTEVPPKVFLYYTEAADPDHDGQPDGGAPIANRVYRYTWNAATQHLEDPLLVLDLPVLDGPNHDGGALVLGPTPTPGPGPAAAGDGSLLYTVIGDLNRDGQLQNNAGGAAPDDTSVIFRVQQDGTPAPGNPFAPYCSQSTSTTCADDGGCPGGESCLTRVARYYAYGVRNSFGLAVDPVSGALWDTENGPESYDEVNRVEAGLDSGWNRIMGPDARDPQSPADLFDMPGGGASYSDPEFSWLTPIAVTGILFPVGSAFGPAYDDVVLVGDFNNGQLYRLPLNASRDGFALSGFAGLADGVADSTAERDLLLFGSGFGGVTDLELGPDGAVYVVSLSGTIFRIETARTPTATATATAKPTATPGANGIGGRISYYMDARPVPDVVVELQGTAPDTRSTDAAGAYSWPDLPGQSWTVVPSKVGGLDAGISSLDASYILQEQVGQRAFSALQDLACDVTGNGSCSSLDAARILQFQVGSLARFAVSEICASDWAFVPEPAAAANQSLLQPQASPGSCQRGAIAYSPLDGQAVEQDFRAVLFGDVTGNWQPPAAAPADGGG